MKRLSPCLTTTVGCRRSPEAAAAQHCCCGWHLLRDYCAAEPPQIVFVVLIVVCRSRSITTEMALFCRLRTVLRLLSFVLGVLVVSVRSFNVDTHAPIVKQGAADSYFGFSVAQHKVLDHGRGFGVPV